MEQLLGDLERAEQMAHDIFSMKSEVISLDAKRNKNREAQRAIINEEKKGSAVNKLWLCSGGMFIKVSRQTAKSMICKDQEMLDKTINELRDNITTRSEELNSLAQVSKVGTSERPRKPLSKEESKSLGSLLPGLVTSLETREGTLKTICEEQ